MSTTWWVAVVLVVVAAMVASVVDGRARAGRRRGGRPSARPPGRAARPSGRRPGGGRPSGGRPGGAGGAPRAGEIWWANVPFEDGPGAKDRPCLVLSVRGRSVRVAKITTRLRPERPGVIALPPDAVGDARGRASFLETGELRDVPVGAFRRRVGRADPALMDRVRRLVG